MLPIRFCSDPYFYWSVSGSTLPLFYIVEFRSAIEQIETYVSKRVIWKLRTKDIDNWLHTHIFLRDRIRFFFKLSRIRNTAEFYCPYWWDPNREIGCSEVTHLGLMHGQYHKGMKSCWKMLIEIQSVNFLFVHLYNPQRI